eukprot:gene31454-38019_t
MKVILFLILNLLVIPALVQSFCIFTCPDPTRRPTARPTRVPTQMPSVVPSQEPSVVPSQIPSVVPTQEPSVVPTQEPSVVPTQEPSVVPSQVPSVVPTQEPSVVPTQEPSVVPTREPSVRPTREPSIRPTQNPSVTPTRKPSVAPSVQPTTTIQPSRWPSRSSPSVSPTLTIYPTPQTMYRSPAWITPRPTTRRPVQVPWRTTLPVSERPILTRSPKTVLSFNSTFALAPSPRPSPSPSSSPSPVAPPPPLSPEQKTSFSDTQLKMSGLVKKSAPPSITTSVRPTMSPSQPANSPTMSPSQSVNTGAKVMVTGSKAKKVKPSPNKRRFLQATNEEDFTWVLEVNTTTSDVVLEDFPDAQGDPSFLFAQLSSNVAEAVNSGSFLEELQAADPEGFGSFSGTVVEFSELVQEVVDVPVLNDDINDAAPSELPVEAPTATPSMESIDVPSATPSEVPTDIPTETPSDIPTCGAFKDSIFVSSQKTYRQIANLATYDCL